ncbi:MAG: glycosyltransferase family 39 protein [Planctomycetota bacterium]
MSRSPFSVWVALSLLCVTGWLGLTSNRPLLLPDEPREAAITLEMARGQDLLVPRLNGQPFVEKPPLMYLLGSSLVRLAGSTSPWLLRLPQTLSMLATLWLVYVLGRRLGGAPAGWASACVLFTTNLFLMNGTKLVVDSGLMLFTAAAIAATLTWWFAERHAALGWAVVAAACLAAAVATKGPAALLFPVAAWAWPVLSDLRRGWRRPLQLALIGVLALAPLVAWAIALEHAGGRGLVEEALVRTSWGRFAHGELGHRNSPLYYLTLGPGLLVPWTLILLVAIAALARSALGTTDARRATIARMLIGWAAGSLVLLSIPAAKRGLYALPAMPAWSVIGGWWLAQRMQDERLRGVGRWCIALTAGIAGAGSLAAAVYLPSVGAWWGVVAVIPGAALLALALDRRTLARPAWSIQAGLAATVLAAAVVSPPLLKSEHDPDTSIDVARRSLPQARARTDRVLGYGLSERGRSVVCLSLGGTVPEIDERLPPSAAAVVADGKTLLISEGELPMAMVRQLQKYAELSPPERSPIGRERYLFAYVLAARRP